MATGVTFEPLSTGDVIDRSVRIYRRNVRPLLAAAAGPFVFGAASALCFKLGMSGLSPGEHSRISALGAGALVVVGLACYVAYVYAMILVVAGVSRAVGDHLVLGKPITLRAVLGALRGRLLDLTVASLLLIGCVLLIVVVTFVTLFASLMVVGIGAGVTAALHLPDWVAGVIVVVVMLAALAGVFLVVLPVLLARVVFIPQIVMIEGAAAGAAAARAFALGDRKWRGVLAILLFTNCAGVSLAMAVMAPAVAILWFAGMLDPQLDTFQSIYGGVTQFASFLVVPVWSIAYTLLYFDSRVRKEGYDVDLLARRLPAPPRPTRPPVRHTVPGDGFSTPAAVPPANARCPRCGTYILSGRPYCAACGWSGYSA